MAATVGSPSVKAVFGDFRFAIIEVTLDSSYPTGGEAVDFTANGEFQTITDVSPTTTSGGIVPVWDQTNKKLLAFYQDGSAGELVQATSTDDLSAETINCLVFGK